MTVASQRSRRQAMMRFRQIDHDVPRRLYDHVSPPTFADLDIIILDGYRTVASER
jgi:hypothetical protein